MKIQCYALYDGLLCQDKGKYEIMTGGLKSADEMVDYYRDIVGRYPTVIALIDVLRKEDREQWMKVCENLSEK